MLRLTFVSLINNQQNRPALPTSFDMTTLEDISLYSCTQYDFMKTADELLSSAMFADCAIDQDRVILHEIFMEGTVTPKIIHTAVIFNLHLLLCKKGWL